MFYFSLFQILIKAREYYPFNSNLIMYPFIILYTERYIRNSGVMKAFFRRIQKSICERENTQTRMAWQTLKQHENFVDFLLRI